MAEENYEDIFARHKKQLEATMKIVVALLFVGLLITIYVLMQD